MDGFIDGTSDTPASKNLFEPGDGVELSEELKEFYHSTVARKESDLIYWCQSHI
jgi:hypothetical protein